MTYEEEDYYNFFENDEDQGIYRKDASILNLQDYNLNSPLMPDFNIKCEKFNKNEILTTGSTLNDSLIRNIKTSLFSYKCNHHYLGKLLQKTTNKNEWFIKILLNSIKDSDLTIEIPTTFLKYLKFPVLEKTNKEIKHKIINTWGQGLIETTVLIILLNNKNSPIYNRYIETLPRWDKTNKKNCERFDFEWFGKFSLGDNCILTDSGYLLDKNFLLMIKDILNARVCAYLSCIGRVDESFDDKSIEDLCKLWIAGDKELEKHGVSSYDVFKFIEPIANQNLIKEAQKIRPDIKLESEFDIFVDNEIDAFTKKKFTFPKYCKQLLENNNNLDFKLSVYGSFRQWGHPYIDFTEGLEKLYEQVTVKKEINDELAQALASDLAFKVLEQKFSERREWMVEKTLIKKDDILKEYIENDIWPPSKILSDYGDNFHKLPLKKCYEIPDFIDPTQIYSDKAHSLPLDELIKDLRSNKKGPCQTKRVLDTLISTESTNWKEFLQEINDKGLDERWLLIGLKAKERELKIIGRYFALLSWKLREYFVMTEYLIKTNFIHLYDGLTMADDLKGVMMKLLSRSDGQGSDTYDSITIANHIDYSKWNNHQRKESNKYVFRVMGQFMGYPLLFERTHEFFEKSLIYYAGDRSLLKIKDGQIVPSTHIRSCWQGQAGGLEGLRQKGWSILNVILLDRISRKRNTRIKLLAQGDNQIICTQFKLTHYDETNRKLCIHEIIKQNKNIMEDVKKGANELGLIINMEETMISTEFLNYGKVPVYRGNILGLKTKRWARVSSYSNDNLPNLSNILSTVASTALSVSHFSQSIVDPIYNYNFFGNFARNILEMFDPCLNNSIHVPKESRRQYVIKSLYLDPSIGGVSGMNLNRFTIRNFPDPITESLSFWKIIYDNTNDIFVKSLAGDCGNPRVKRGNLEDLKSLLEDPTSINIPRGLSPITLLRNEIKLNMIENVNKIKNQIIKDVTIIGNKNELQLLNFLKNIKPIFPKFLAQLKSGTVCGIKDSFVSLYENSRTIRKNFKDSMRYDFDEKVIECEAKGIEKLFQKISINETIFGCSSKKADELRKISWGADIVGMTIPHPSELLDPPTGMMNCDCKDGSRGPYLTTICNIDDPILTNKRGPLVPYLGSTTSEGTSIITPWEKESKIPFLKRVIKMRDAINWFIEPNSNLSKSIFNIIESVTGSPLESTVEYKQRTGSAIHRFSTERQSSGGYNAISPMSLMRVFSTTDTLGELCSKNWDFMFQSIIIWMQTAISHPLGYVLEGQRTYHSHIHCNSCLREIDDITLESTMIYQPPSIQNMIEKWIPNIEDQWIVKNTRTYDIISPISLNYSELNYYVGQTIGFVFGETTTAKKSKDINSSLFPNSIADKIEPKSFLKGLIQGIINSSALNSLSRKSLNTLKDPYTAIGGNAINIINKLTSESQFLCICRSENMTNFLLIHPHRIPPSYPLNLIDQAAIIKSVLREYLRELLLDKRQKCLKVILFSDICSHEIELPLVLGALTFNIIISNIPKKNKLDELRKIKNTNILSRDKMTSSYIPKLQGIEIKKINSEIRHVLKFSNTITTTIKPKITFGIELTGDIYPVLIKCSLTKESYGNVIVPQNSNPLISGLRLFQMATGAHYKIRSIIKYFDINYRWFGSFGDGSGGISSALLRYNEKSECIFNSLLDLENVSLRGTKPSPPSAIDALGYDRIRCVNIDSCWEYSSDLREQRTWDYFEYETKKRREKFDLITLDMEVTSSYDAIKILENFDLYCDSLIKKNGAVIYKTYLNVILNETINPLTVIVSHFEEVFAVQTEFTSSQSSEIYVVGLKKSKYKIIKNISSETIHDLIKNNFSLKSYDHEWERAKRVRKMDMYRGVSYLLRTPIEVEIENLLISINIPSGLSHSLADSLAHGNIDNSEIKWDIIRMCDHFNLETGEVKTGSYIPSDQKCIIFLSFLVGAFFSLSLDYDIDMQQKLTYTTENGIHFQLYKNQTSDNKLMIKWTFSDSGKFISIRSKMALIGSTIRVFERLNERIKNKHYKLSKYIKTENLNLTGIPKLWDHKGPIFIKRVEKPLIDIDINKIEVDDYTYD
ncbi:polymerase [Boteke virus]|uniref:Replicase n=3 Tax=Boteke virus TaxID=864698 RepID=A0AAE8XD62_9RHAB|nr:polymerase [Boteke virus]UAU42847.1 polymerase [Boteke virus]